MPPSPMSRPLAPRPFNTQPDSVTLDRVPEDIRQHVPSLNIAFYMSSVPMTMDVVQGRTSLGGSESAMLAVARALAVRGHQITVFATQLHAALHGLTLDGLTWRPAEDTLAASLKSASFDVFVSLRMHDIYAFKMSAKLNLHWAQDMISEPISGWLSQIDGIVYVSDWHRTQWEAVDDTVARMPSWVTKNPIDMNLAIAATGTAKRSETPASPHHFIHISRPERAHDALIALWPKIRAAFPGATLDLCRYSSMYDATGWGRVCAEYDARIQELNSEVGGITYLGELNKRDLYAAIARADLMLYPNSQRGFAETHCIAAVEAQACGTPFLGCYRGALPEVVHPKAGMLVELSEDFAWRTDAFHDKWIDAMRAMLHPMKYASMVGHGVEWTKTWDAAMVAADWEDYIYGRFTERLKRHPIKVLRRLLNDDNHVPARMLAGALAQLAPQDEPGDAEVLTALARCERVIAQEDQTAEDYGARALPNPVYEAETSERLQRGCDLIADYAMGLQTEGGIIPDGAEESGQRQMRVLDVACGNGAMLHLLRKALPKAALFGVDYSSQNVIAARKVLGIEGAVDDTGAVTAEDVFAHLAETPAGIYDAAFCGEFLEHVESPWTLVDLVEKVVRPGGRVVFTCPSGPFSDLIARDVPLKRGHLWSYSHRDILTLFGDKPGFHLEYLDAGFTQKGDPVGFWVISFNAPDTAASSGGRTLTPTLNPWRAILVERPYATVHAMLIVRDAEAFLHRCLTSLWGVVDRVFITDTGSIDRTVAIAEAVAPAHPGWITVKRVPWPDDFSVARNLVLDWASPGADWVFWIDADEYLDRPECFRDYLTLDSPFVGVAVRQQHLHLDRPNEVDRPKRAFRTGHNIRFYGVVHEQPETAVNEDILPSLLAERCGIVHHGYHTAIGRVLKMRDRNLSLLRKELDGKGTHPPRELAYVLAMRDYVNFATLDASEHGSTVCTPQGREWCGRAIAVYRNKKLDDPTNALHTLAWKEYQRALDFMSQDTTPVGMQVGWAFAAAPALSGRPRSEMFRVLDSSEITRELHYRVEQYAARLKRGAVAPVPASPILPSNFKGYRQVGSLRPVD